MFEYIEYKELYKRQKILTDNTIATAKEWKKLSEEITQNFEEVITKDLPEATITIQKLQKQNNKLILELALYKSKYGGKT